MSNLRLLYNTLFDQATLSLEPDTGGEEAAWPVTNIQTTILSEAWKCPLGAVRILIDLGAAQALSGLGLASHDLLAAAGITVRAYSDAWTSEVWSQEFEAVGPIQGWLEGGWLSGGWLGYPAADDQILYPRVTSLLVFDRLVGARYVAVDIDNGGQAFYIGRMFLGEMFVPALNFSLDPKITPEHDIKSDSSLGGVDFTDEGSKYLSCKLTLPQLGRNEAIGGAFWQVARYVGRSRHFILQVYSDNAKIGHATTMVAKFEQNPAVQGWGPDQFRAPFEAREMV